MITVNDDSSVQILAEMAAPVEDLDPQVMSYFTSFKHLNQDSMNLIEIVVHNDTCLEGFVTLYTF